MNSSSKTSGSCTAVHQQRNTGLQMVMINFGSSVGLQSDTRHERFRAEPDIGATGIGLKRVGSDIMSDIRFFFLHTNIEYLTYGSLNVHVYFRVRVHVHAHAHTHAYVNNEHEHDTGYQYWTSKVSK
jgi:hypothetical protein